MVLYILTFTFLDSRRDDNNDDDNNNNGGGGGGNNNSNDDDDNNKIILRTKRLGCPPSISAIQRFVTPRLLQQVVVFAFS
jgi:hypothetical protein